MVTDTRQVCDHDVMMWGQGVRFTLQLLKCVSAIVYQSAIKFIQKGGTAYKLTGHIVRAVVRVGWKLWIMLFLSKINDISIMSIKKCDTYTIRDFVRQRKHSSTVGVYRFSQKLWLSQAGSSRYATAERRD